eukprot:TRINITY_DN5329_c0_g1_i12.p1 TRINITY_DN5329_c0_g1~~TRINITY_DN5329_c0_g1_i12.p1  ORF type:complete len:115 (-),score=20.33 TRINITY_DN5329_c0_g1_i12:53-397(-)
MCIRDRYMGNILHTRTNARERECYHRSLIGIMSNDPEHNDINALNQGTEEHKEAVGGNGSVPLKKFPYDILPLLGKRASPVSLSLIDEASNFSLVTAKTLLLLQKQKKNVKDTG